MAVLPGPYFSVRINWSGSTSTTFDAVRRIGTDGPEILVGDDIPILGTTPDGRSMWFDTTAPIGTDVYYNFTGNSGASTGWVGPYQLPVLGAVWLTDPMRPWADIQLDTCPVGGHRDGCPNPAPEVIWGGFTGDLVARDDVGLFDVLNSERPADVFARRKFADGSIRFFTTTLDAIDRVYDLFTAGGPLLLRLPDEYGWHDAFIQPRNLERAYVSRDQRRPLRVWDFDFTIVDQPFGPIQGTDCNNWCDVKEAFPTFADLTAYPGTWYDLVSGDVLCPDTPPGEDGFGLGPFGDGPFGDGG